MGISIETYRMRIGSFSQGTKKFKPTGPKPSSAPSGKAILTLATIFGISFFLFTVALQTDFTVQVKPQSSPSSSILCQTPSPSLILPTSKFQAAFFGYYARSLQIVDVNFNSRYLYGNRRSNGIKMAHINLGSGFLVNQMNNIESIIGGYKSHILGVSESNFRTAHEKSDATLEEYTTYFSKTLENENLGVSRITVFAHKDLIIKDRPDLMNDIFSSIWLELGLPRKKKILVCNLYRDWQYLDQDSDESLSTAAQLTRWLSFLDQWKAAMAEDKEIHVMGDTNLDFLKWEDPSQPGSQRRNRLHKLSNAVFDRVFSFGFVQLITTATRFWPGQEPSGLDHWYTNKPGKL